MWLNNSFHVDLKFNPFSSISEHRASIRIYLLFCDTSHRFAVQLSLPQLSPHCALISYLSYTSFRFGFSFCIKFKIRIVTFLRNLESLRILFAVVRVQFIRIMKNDLKLIFLFESSTASFFLHRTSHSCGARTSSASLCKSHVPLEIGTGLHAGWIIFCFLKLISLFSVQ